MESKVHDYNIYLFQNELLSLINNSKLSWGELDIIISNLCNTIHQQYLDNIQIYVAQKLQDKSVKETEEVFSKTFNADELMPAILANKKEESSGQE